MRDPSRVAYRAVASPTVAALGLALLILGPALSPGVVIAYDLSWAPEPAWTPFVLGVDTPAPRAVPGDAVAVLLGKILSASLAQKAVLVSVLVLAGSGAAALLSQLRPKSSRLARTGAVVAAMWNPFVSERLAIGHWSVLLGYAVLPWLIRSILRLSAAQGSLWTTSSWVVLASLGGGNPLVVALPGLAALILARVPWQAATTVALVWLGGAAVWAIPALGGPAPRLADGVTAFVPRADTPFGVVLSLVSGGGFWSAATHPAPRDNWFIALLATLLAAALATVAGRELWHRGGRPVVVVAILGLLVCVVSALPVFVGLWSLAITALPGGGLLRDSHKLLAPWVILLALGAGLAIDAVRSKAATRQWSTAAVILLVAGPIALLPTLVWGVAGHLQAVDVPDGYRRVADVASDLPPGTVGLLPWNQYRRYEWNGSRISLTLAPRAIDQVILFDDSLPLTDGRVAGENPRAADVTRRIQGGEDPAAALVQEGVSYLAIELGSGEAIETPEDFGPVVARSAELVIVKVSSNPPHATGPGRLLVLGWAISLATWTFVLGGATVHRVQKSYRRV